MVSLFEDMSLWPVGNLVTRVGKSHSGIAKSEKGGRSLKGLEQVSTLPTYLQSVPGPLVQWPHPTWTFIHRLRRFQGKATGSRESFSRHQLKAS